MAEVLTSHNIRSESRRKKFLRMGIRRFEEEGLLAALKRHSSDPMDANKIQQEAALLVREKNEDEILAELGSELPEEAIQFLLKIDAAAKRQLTAKEIRYLPTSGDIQRRSALGRAAFGSLKHVMWRSLCDPNSEIYKVWYGQGLQMVLNKNYFAIAVSTILFELGIGIKMLAVSATALCIKFGLEVYCDSFRPESIMSNRESQG